MVYTKRKGFDIMKLNKENKKGLVSMTATVQKWGNSLGVRIPKKIADELDLVNGSEIKLVKKGKKLILEPAEKIPTLEELMASVSLETQHEEVDWGKPEGEEW